MTEIPLQAVANQAFSVQLDGRRYTFTIKETRGMMAADVVRDDETLITGQRIVAGAPILPYRFLQDAGNFCLLTENDELPHYASFGFTQRLYYLTADEVAELKGA